MRSGDRDQVKQHHQDLNKRWGAFRLLYKSSSETMLLKTILSVGDGPARLWQAAQNERTVRFRLGRKHAHFRWSQVKRPGRDKFHCQESVENRDAPAEFPSHGSGP